MERIPLYQVRNFGEKFNATFDFFKQTWKVLFRFSLYLLLPLSLLQTVGMDEYYSTTFAMSTTNAGETDPVTLLSQMGAPLLVVILVSIVATVAVFSLVYSLMKYYRQGGALDGLTFKAFWKEVMGRVCLRVCLMMLFGTLLTVLACTLAGLLAYVTPFSLIVTIPAILVFALPLALWAPSYLLEDDTNMIDALRKSYRYGMKTWGSLFVLMLVMSIIVYMASCILMMPGMIMIVIKVLAFPQIEGFGSMAYAFVTFIVMAAGMFFNWMAMLPYLIAFGYHYGSAAEKIDNVTAADDIAHFNEMGDNNVDDPALEPVHSEIDDFEEL